MPWDVEANDLFPHTVTITPPGAKNAYGREVAGVGGATRRALVEYTMRMVRDMKGDETLSSITVYLSGAGGVSGITPDWTLVLPDTSSRPILSVSRYPDETGDLIEVVHLQ
jgi:hypothetical protein